MSGRGKRVTQVFLRDLQAYNRDSDKKAVLCKSYIVEYWQRVESEWVVWSISSPLKNRRAFFRSLNAYFDHDYCMFSASDNPPYKAATVDIFIYHTPRLLEYGGCGGFVDETVPYNARMCVPSAPMFVYSACSNAFTDNLMLYQRSDRAYVTAYHAWSNFMYAFHVTPDMERVDIHPVKIPFDVAVRSSFSRVYNVDSCGNLVLFDVWNLSGFPVHCSIYNIDTGQKVAQRIVKVGRYDYFAEKKATEYVRFGRLPFESEDFYCLLLDSGHPSVCNVYLLRSERIVSEAMRENAPLTGIELVVSLGEFVTSFVLEDPLWYYDVLDIRPTGALIAYMDYNKKWYKRVPILCTATAGHPFKDPCKLFRVSHNALSYNDLYGTLKL